MPIAMAMPIIPGSSINNSVMITIAPDAEARGVARGVTPRPPRAPANERAEPGVGGCIEPGVGGLIAAGRICLAPRDRLVNSAAPDRR